MNYELIVVIVASYLVGVITTKMRSKCSVNDEVVVDKCPYSQEHHAPSKA
jgi:hypothetical protein